VKTQQGPGRAFLDIGVPTRSFDPPASHVNRTEKLKKNKVDKQLLADPNQAG